MIFSYSFIFIFSILIQLVNTENNKFILFSFDLYVLAKIYKLNAKEEKAQGEYGLESLGKPTNDYFREKYKEKEGDREFIGTGRWF